MAVNSAKCLLFLVVSSQFLSCKTTNTNDSDLKFYGKDAKRAQLTFSHKVVMELPENFSGEVTDLNDLKWMADVDEHIRLQLSHMFGAFVNHDRPFNFVDNPGIPRERPDIKVTKIEPARGDFVNIYYDYSDVAAFKKDIFKGLKATKIQFYLPKNPGEIYLKGLVPAKDAKRIYQDDEWALKDIEHAVEEGATSINLCTDLHYQTEDDYWYFWNPYQRGCPQSTKDAVEQVNAVLKPFPSTVETYPRYRELYGDNGNGKKLLITFLVGVDENFKKTDLGVQGFEKTFRILSEGKSLLSDPNVLATIAKLKNEEEVDDTDLLLAGEISLLKATPDNEDVVFKVAKSEKRFRQLTLTQNGYQVELNMHLVNPDSESFVDLAVAGLQKSDIFMYDGHSGLGGYLSVGRLFGERKKTLPTDKYQIFFFNGCSTFSYYNFDFFQQKVPDPKKFPAEHKEDPNGYKNLEILTTSVPATFSRGPGSDSWLLRGLLNGKRSRWQKIIDDIFRVAPDDSALTAVNGDEDKWNKQK